MTSWAFSPQVQAAPLALYLGLGGGAGAWEMPCDRRSSDSTVAETWGIWCVDSSYYSQPSRSSGALNLRSV